MAANWSQELSIQLIHLVHDNECLWNTNISGVSLEKKNQIWESIFDELKRDNPDFHLGLVDIKERYNYLRHSYITMTTKYQANKIKKPKSWIYDLLQFIPLPKHKELVTFTNNETEKLINHILANECLWLKKDADGNAIHYKAEIIDKAVNKILKKLQKSNPEINLCLLQRKISRLKTNFYKYEEGRERKPRQKPPLWYKELLFLKANMRHSANDEVTEESAASKSIESIDEISHSFTEEIDNNSNDTEYNEHEIMEITEVTLDTEESNSILDAKESYSMENTKVSDSEIYNITEETCCICLNNDAEYSFRDSFSNDTPTFLNCYERFFQLSFDDGNKQFPQKICADCATKLMATYELAEMAINSNKILKSFLSSQIWLDCGNSDEQLVATVEVVGAENILIQESRNVEEADDDLISVDKIEELISSDDLNQIKVEQEQLSLKYCDQLSGNEEENNDGNDDDGNVYLEEECYLYSENEESYEVVVDDSLENKPPAKRKRKKENLMCHICSKILSKQSALEYHLLTHDKDRKREYECEVCGLKTFSIGSLNWHKKIHDPERIVYQCEFCDKSYFTVSSLNVHKRIHTGETFPCTLCPKEFCTKLELTTHLNIHLGNKTYECEICGEKFYRNSTYNKHKNKEHKLLKYKCSSCDKEYKTPRDLKVHMYSHVGEFPYECELCGQGKTSRYKCRLHIMQVHEIEDIDEANEHVKMVDCNAIMETNRKRAKAASKLVAIET